MFRIVQQIKYYHLLDCLMFAKTQFKSTPERFSFPQEEQITLKYWTEIDAFKQQLQKTKHLPPFTFYDGPPFATGTPHYGHIAAGTIKDVVCRYACQTGHYVSRRFGWDCHGLPIEYQIDKQLKITNKKQVFDMGIQNYNKQCRNIVMRYSNIWEDVVNRFGRWIDFKNDYKTMDLNFMESVWHAFKQLHNRGLVYRGRRIMPYSNACNTVLSNFQVQQNYKQTNDPSVFVTFPMKTDENVKFLAWTTTPWTLPSNLALAVNSAITYVKVKDVKRDQVYIMAESRLKDFFGKQKFEILQQMKGVELEGIQYVPLFDCFADRQKDGCFRVQTGSFVTDTDGTGVVHCAPGFGQEDYRMCVQKKIINPDSPPVPLDENGRFTNEVALFEGEYVKDADPKIIKYLKQKGRVVQHGTIKHNYPFCWRSQTPLIYKAVATWFIKVTDLKQDLVVNNHKAQWVPKVIQEKKFDNWLKDAKDWCFSRNRFWGNPIPLWVSDDGEEMVCVGSVKQLQELTGAKITDLHRESIDHLTIESKKGKGKLKRIEEVFDCWFESGSMPFAQVHYPFSTNQQEFSKIYPADFIGEGIDQTRGWFYTLNVISTGIKNMNPYKNLIVNGLVLTEDGKKMSKRLKNYPDPTDVCKQFGADAIRLYLINSPLVKADNLCFSKKGVQGVVRQIFLPWYNAYRFLLQNISKMEVKANLNFEFVQNLEVLSQKFNVTDKWILSSLQILIKNIRKQMKQYKLYNVVPQLVKFLEQLTNWYVRLNRPRLKGEVDDDNMNVSLNVLFDVLHKVNVLMSPYVPFLTEHMYQNMKKVINKDSKSNYEQSIHHLFIAEVNEKLIDQKITEQMNNMQVIIESARKLREEKKVSLKQPIMSLKVVNRNPSIFNELKQFLPYIQEEINVENIGYEGSVDKYVKLQALPNLPVLGPKFKGNKNFGNVKNGVTKLTSLQLQKFKQTKQIQIAGQKLTHEDIIIKEKFINDNISENEAIGGSKIIVLLDARQDEELKVRGFARQIITRVQKLKKKSKLQAEDAVLVFYDFGENSKYLNEAINKEEKTIRAAIKKPILHIQKYYCLAHLAVDKGTIDEQPYLLRLCAPGPVFNFAQLKADFGDQHEVLAKAIMTMPYNSIKNKESITVRLDGKDLKAEAKKHYEILI